jgi:hypothetical protein
MTALFFSPRASSMRLSIINSAARCVPELALTGALALIYFALLSGGAA